MHTDTVDGKVYKSESTNITIRTDELSKSYYTFKVKKVLEGLQGSISIDHSDY